MPTQPNHLPPASAALPLAIALFAAWGTVACALPPETIQSTTIGQTLAVAPGPLPTPTAVVFAPVPHAGAVPRYGVAEAFRHDKAAELGISWERNVFSWSAIQPNGPTDWRADAYFPPRILQREHDLGVETVGVIQFTPPWAAEKPADGERSVPKNLALPPDSPDNYWVRFTNRLSAHYQGRIDRWIIWNEPEFKPGDPGAGDSYSWLGSDEEYYLLLKRAYQGIKAANPSATIVFSGTSYWVDVNMKRPTFFKRVLDIATADPEGPANGLFFDAVAFNLYRCPDDLYRIYSEVKAAMRAKGVDKPIWITETNAMPYDDPATPKPSDGQRVTLAQQADYVVQALALASSAGYEWLSWYRIDDGDIWQAQEAWGLVRSDGSERPAFRAMQTAINLFTGATRSTFTPLERATRPFGTPWPQNPASYYPNWQVYQVVFDHAGGRRVTVLWNGDAKPLRVQVPKRGSDATLVDVAGVEKSIAATGDVYELQLPAATAHGPHDPPDYYYIGGSPIMLVEQGVPPASPIQPPQLASTP